MESNTHRLIGTRLGTCELKQLIGFGGMGIVFLARQIRPSRDVAVKVLLARGSVQTEGEQEFLVRFRREANVIAQLDHINILPIYEYGEQNGLAYLVTPYLEGGSLRDLLAKRAPLSTQEALIYTEQAAAALQYAHTHNIVHRDVKPGNMLFHADGRLVLVDFGIARIMHNTDENIESTLTSTGQFLGSVNYMAPEMVRGRQPDHRTDIYELGVVLFEMLSGRTPFQGTSTFMIAAQHVQEIPPSLSSLNPNITPQVDAVVQKALAKDPDQRYSSVSELALALRQASGMLPLVVSSPITPIPNIINIATTSLPGTPVAIEALQGQPSPDSYSPNPPNLTPRLRQTIQTNLQKPFEPVTMESPFRPADTTSGTGLSQHFASPIAEVPQRSYIPPATTRGNTKQGQLKGIAIIGLIVFFLTGAVLFGMQTLKGPTSPSQIPTPILSVPTLHATAPTPTLTSSTPTASPAPTPTPASSTLASSSAPTPTPASSISTSPATPTPQPTPTPSPSPALLAQVTIQHYYDDVNKADYQDAYQLWGTNYQLAHPYNQFAAGYANTQHVDIVFHTITAQADGSQLVAMTIYATDKTASGNKLSAFQGSYIVGKENGVWKLLNYHFDAMSMGTPTAMLTTADISSTALITSPNSRMCERFYYECNYNHFIISKVVLYNLV